MPSGQFALCLDLDSMTLINRSGTKELLDVHLCDSSFSTSSKSFGHSGMPVGNKPTHCTFAVFCVNFLGFLLRCYLALFAYFV